MDVRFPIRVYLLESYTPNMSNKTMSVMDGFGEFQVY